jgi:hypothetical protein
LLVDVDVHDGDSFLDQECLAEMAARGRAERGESSVLLFVDLELLLLRPLSHVTAQISRLIMRLCSRLLFIYSFLFFAAARANNQRAAIAQAHRKVHARERREKRAVKRFAARRDNNRGSDDDDDGSFSRPFNQEDGGSFTYGDDSSDDDDDGGGGEEILSETSESSNGGGSEGGDNGGNMDIFKQGRALRRRMMEAVAERDGSQPHRHHHHQHTLDYSNGIYNSDELTATSRQVWRRSAIAGTYRQ